MQTDLIIIYSRINLEAISDFLKNIKMWTYIYLLSYGLPQLERTVLA